MAIDFEAGRSRRAILAGALGGTMALAAQGLGRPLPARAGIDGDVVLGGSNTTTTTTILTNTGSSIVFKAVGKGSGLWGESTNGAGTVGVSQISTGVHGATYSAIHPGVKGVALTTGTGVCGLSGDYEDFTTPAKTGVLGCANQDDTSVGVLGRSPAGHAVEGITTTGRGVAGTATTGRGVHGNATSGTGVYAAAGTGWALRAVGRVKLDKAAGIASIAQGSASVLVDPGIALSSTSVVVATLRSSAGGSIAVHRVVVDSTADTFRIYLTANATVAASVSWIVVN